MGDDAKWVTVGRVDLDAMTPEERDAWDRAFRKVDRATGLAVPVAVVLDAGGRLVRREPIPAARN